MNLSQRLLLVFLFASLFDNVQKLRAQPEKLRAQPGRGPSTVVVSRVISSKMASSMDFIGTVTPIQNSIIGSAVDGRVESVLADEGDPVFKSGSKDPLIAKMGQPLMQMRTGTLQIEIDAAEILLNTRKDALDELKTSLPSDIEQATATVEDYQARLEYSKSYYERMQSLFGNGGGSSANERDEAFSKYRSAEASLKAAQSALQKLHGTKAKRLSQAAFAVATQEAEIRRLQDVKTKYTIRAPFDGYVVSRMANVGQWVSRGEDVFQVVQLDPIEVAFKVPQSSVQRLQEAFDSAKTSDETLPARIWIESIGTTDYWRSPQDCTIGRFAITIVPSQDSPEESDDTHWPSDQSRYAGERFAFHWKGERKFVCRKRCIGSRRRSDTGFRRYCQCRRGAFDGTSRQR